MLQAAEDDLESSLTALFLAILGVGSVSQQWIFRVNKIPKSRRLLCGSLVKEKMKFMRLGSKPDVFQAEGSSVRCVSSELATDIVINVGGVKFHLHKFPLLSKSSRLQKLASESTEESAGEIQLVDFPGGPKAFEICAKFCYGITLTLNCYNLVATRCAAQYLEMTEDVDRGNLILKIEVFLNSSVLRTWKDAIIVLQTTKYLLPWSETLKIVGRCIDSTASKTSVDPSVITWSYTYNRKTTTPGEIIQGGLKSPRTMESVPKDWWVEDICELDIDLYKRVMVAIKSKGIMDGSLTGEALKTYAIRWLPDTVDALVSEGHIHRNKSLVETIICLLPSDKGVTCSCSFLLKLLKVAILIGADDSSREDLIKSIGLKLDEAYVNDLLIPARLPQTTTYDIELVLHLVDQFVANHDNNSHFKMVKTSKSETDFVLGHVLWLKLGKLIDGYLAEIACDPNLSVSIFIKLSQSIPESARPIHDGLYGAIDIYLKVHKNLTKSERKSLCSLMDVKKLTTEATMHAAQNEQLPLRVVVQVLFFEHARAAASVHALSNAAESRDPPTKGQENCEKTSPGNPKSFAKKVDELKIKDEELLSTSQLATKGRGSNVQLLPSRSRRIFDQLWLVGKGLGVNLDNISSETSASSQSPTSVVQGGAKLSVLASRNRRHSIS